MKKTQRRKLSLGFACISMFVIIFLNELNTIDWNTMENYYSNVGDALHSAEDPTFAPKTNSIFFHDTSYYGGLTPRQACSVEAAARTHPERDVYVLFSSPVTDYTLKTSCLAKLLEFSNVKFLRVHIAEYSKGTVVQSILLNDLRESTYPIQHAADILRILTLNKWGGICIDTDIILIKSLQRMPPNWIVKQEETFVATGIMSFSKNEAGHNMTSSILEEIYKTYDPNDWFITGRKAIKKVIQRICPKRIYWDSCRDIAIYPYELFYSIDHILWTTEIKVAYYQPNYSFRIWPAHSDSGNKIVVTPNEMLARKYCPSIFLLYRDELGV